jgi:hypothetical protein
LSNWYRVFIDEEVRDTTINFLKNYAPILGKSLSLRWCLRSKKNLHKSFQVHNTDSKGWATRLSLLIALFFSFLFSLYFLFSFSCYFLFFSGFDYSCLVFFSFLLEKVSVHDTLLFLYLILLVIRVDQVR